MRETIKKILLEYRDFTPKESKILNFIINDIVNRTIIYNQGDDPSFDRTYGNFLRDKRLLIKFPDYTWGGHVTNYPHYMYSLDDDNTNNEAVVNGDWFYNMLEHQYSEKLGINFNRKDSKYLWDIVRKKLKNKFKNELSKEDYERTFWQH